MTLGKFVVLEGGEGCGKSTQARRLAARLDAVLTREPGGTAIGEQVRGLLLDRAMGGLDPRAEALLMAADRAQHVAEIVRPALDTGRHVVSDRYVHSSMAYQGYGRGLPVEEVHDISAWATHGLWPDVVVLLDVPGDVAQRRLGTLDRFEAEGGGFHERVVAGFRAMAAEDPDLWVVVDGVGTVDEVAARILAAVGDRIGL